MSIIQFSIKLALLFVAATSLQPIDSQKHEGSELPEDCDKDQYYDLEQESCRNCSDAMRLLFDMNQLYQIQDWTKITTSNSNDAPVQKPAQGHNTSDHQPSNLDADRSKSPKYGSASEANEVLSRLLANDDYQDGSRAEINQQDPSVDAAQETSEMNNDNYAFEDQFDQQERPAQSGDSADSINRSNKQTVKLLNRLLRSDPMGRDVFEAINQCKQYQNSSACQMWSNLCVLTQYSHSSDSMMTSKSSSFRDSESANNYHNGAKSTPEDTARIGWQRCPQFNINSICNGLREYHRIEKKSSAVEMRNIFAEEDKPLNKFDSPISMRINQMVQLLAYIYSYDGQLIKVGQFDLDYMDKFCVINPIAIEATDYNNNNNLLVQHQNLRVGQNMKLRCQPGGGNLDSMFARVLPKHVNETVFVDLFIGHQSNGAMYIKPVPILIKNLLFNGNQINRKYAHDPTRWKLVHRFFYKSTVSIETGATVVVAAKDSKSSDKHEDILIYIRQANLDLKFKKLDRGNLLMNSLLLTLDYDHTPIRSLRSQDSDNNRSSFNAKTTPGAAIESNIYIKQTLVDMLSYKKDLELVLTIICILSGIWSLVKCYNVQKYHGLVKLDIYSLILFIILSCDILANIITLVSLIMLASLFVALKWQSIGLQVFAPNDDLESSLLINMQLAFVFKLIGLIYKLYIRLRADTFFIDWERPKMLTSAQILKHSSYYNNKSNTATDGNKNLADKNNASNQFLIDGSITTITGSLSSSPLSQQQQQQQPQTSFWRPYTVINRWIELQTKRRLNLTFHLILFVCILEWSQLTNLATADSNWDIHTTSNSRRHNGDDHYQQQVPHLTPCTSLAFRLLILSTVYMSLACLQVAYLRLIHESMIRSSVREFVDLCSVANVSLFSMLYPRFGYYIHGRNANGSGDCSILEMNALLEREERDLCSKRGLAPNSDHQTFILILPRIINDHYRKLLFRNDQQTMGGAFNANNRLLSSVNNQSRANFNGISDNILKSAITLTSSSTGAAPTPLSSSSSFSSNRAIIETIVARNRAINLFLTNFLDHIYKDIDYMIRERRRFESILMDVDFNNLDDEAQSSSMGTGRTGTPTILGGPLASSHHHHPHDKLNPATAATFCVDHRDDFVTLVWLGIEWDLILTELLSLLVLDLWLGQPELILTVSLIWLIQKLFKTLYASCARNNLITKSMLDEKFLTR